jgi:RNA polymerase sigma-70 factor (ECF subfamily)
VSEDELLERISRGDVEALGELYDRYSGLLYQFALALVRSRDGAEEVVQDSFLGLLKSRSQLASIRDIRSYLLRIVRNEVSHRWRRHETDASALEVVEAREGLSTKEVLEVNEALARLPEEQLTVVVLKVWQGMTFAEVAEALDIPANTAASRYRYALEKLRQWLK